MDEAGGILLSLGPFAEEDVIALWRSVVSSSGLLPMVRKEGSDTVVLARQVGRLRLGSGRQAPRLVVLGGRRPRFLVRRKSARLPARPRVHAEREIAAGAAT